MSPRSPRRKPASPHTADARPAPPAQHPQPRLLSVRNKRPSWADVTRFPFCVPAIASLDTLDLDAPVVCFVGENGSGKSTLLEAIAIAAALPSAGGVGRALDDPTLADQRSLASALRLSWRTRSTRGLFLRAEDFFNFQLRVAQERAEFLANLARLQVEYADRSLQAKALAMGPAQASLSALERRYGADPDARSHGEAFLNFFQERLVPGGLYLLDEPEAALSPQRQLTLLAMMLDLVREGAQFILATHSPLLLAYPEARLYSFDEATIERVAWDDTEHVRITRDFLADPERYLRQLRG